jgi:hypothetical protein
MNGPRIVLQGRRDQVRQLGQKLIQPEEGLRPWRKIATVYLPGDQLIEKFAPLSLTRYGRPQRILIWLDDYCEECTFSGQCPGRGVEANARACADVEVSRLRRQIEAEANPIWFTYQPPAYGEEDMDYEV